MESHPVVVRFVPRETSDVDAGLLAGANTNDLAVPREADAIALGILQRNRRNAEVALRGFRERGRIFGSCDFGKAIFEREAGIVAALG